jgi:methoxymalonate biosynthesis acyl carrier protein
VAETSAEVRDFVLRITRLRDLGDEDDILEAGLVNSLFLAQTLTFIEEKLGIEVNDDELIPDNFRSIGAITRMIERLQARAMAP